MMRNHNSAIFEPEAPSLERRSGTVLTTRPRNAIVVQGLSRVGKTTLLNAITHSHMFPYFTNKAALTTTTTTVVKPSVAWLNVPCKWSSTAAVGDEGIDHNNGAMMTNRLELELPSQLSELAVRGYAPANCAAGGGGGASSHDDHPQQQSWYQVTNLPRDTSHHHDGNIHREQQHRSTSFIFRPTATGEGNADPSAADDGDVVHRSSDDDEQQTTAAHFAARRLREAEEADSNENSPFVLVDGDTARSNENSTTSTSAAADEAKKLKEDHVDDVRQLAVRGFESLALLANDNDATTATAQDGKRFEFVTAEPQPLAQDHPAAATATATSTVTLVESAQVCDRPPMHQVHSVVYVMTRDGMPLPLPCSPTATESPYNAKKGEEHPSSSCHLPPNLHSKTDERRAALNSTLRAATTANGTLCKCLVVVNLQQQQQKKTKQTNEDSDEWVNIGNESESPSTTEEQQAATADAKTAVVGGEAVVEVDLETMREEVSRLWRVPACNVFLLNVQHALAAALLLSDHNDTSDEMDGSPPSSFVDVGGDDEAPAGEKEAAVQTTKSEDVREFNRFMAALAANHQAAQEDSCRRRELTAAAADAAAAATAIESSHQEHQTPVAASSSADVAKAVDDHHHGRPPVESSKDVEEECHPDATAMLPSAGPAAAASTSSASSYVPVIFRDPHVAEGARIATQVAAQFDNNAPPPSATSGNASTSLASALGLEGCLLPMGGGSNPRGVDDTNPTERSSSSRKKTSAEQQDGARDTHEEGGKDRGDEYVPKCVTMADAVPAEHPPYMPKVLNSTFIPPNMQ